MSLFLNKAAHTRFYFPLCIAAAAAVLSKRDSVAAAQQSTRQEVTVIDRRGVQGRQEKGRTTAVPGERAATATRLRSQLKLLFFFGVGGVGVQVPVSFKM